MVGPAIGTAGASPPSVDSVIAVIDRNIEAEKWNLADRNIESLEKTIYQELVVRKHPVSLPSNPVDAHLAVVVKRLQDLKAEHKALSDALAAAQRLSAKAGKQAILDIGGELVSKLELINPDPLSPISAADSKNASIIAQDFAALRNANAAVRYLSALRKSLMPAVRAAQKDRAHLLDLKRNMDKVIRDYTPKGLTVGGSVPPATTGWSGSWSTDWGTMTLSQSGSTVTGTYEHDSGKIQGTVNGSTLTGRWSEAPSYAGPRDAGTFTWTLSADGKSFSGSWTYDGGGGGSWTGTR